MQKEDKFFTFLWAYMYLGKFNWEKRAKFDQTNANCLLMQAQYLYMSQPTKKFYHLPFRAISKTSFAIP